MSSFTRSKKTEFRRDPLTNAQRNELITYLCEEHSFDYESLMGWLDSTRKASFWDVAISDKELNYSPAQELYLSTVFESSFGVKYETELREMARLMWESRNQAINDAGFNPAMDATLIMLCEHVKLYTALYEFDQEKFRAKPISVEELTMHVELIERRYSNPLAMQFALEWLSFHLPYFANEYRFPKPEAEPEEEDDDSGGGSTAWGMEPGAGQ